MNRQFWRKLKKLILKMKRNFLRESPKLRNKIKRILEFLEINFKRTYIEKLIDINESLYFNIIIIIIIIIRFKIF